jgi:hypothetical protein
MAEPALVAEDVHRHYGDTLALDPDSYSVDDDK